MDKSNVVDIPLKFRRDYSPAWDGSSRCPYCLENLQNQPDTQSPQNLCHICRHEIPATIRGVPLHALSRPQQWDFLANEIRYLLVGQRRDVESYIFAMGEHYNPDYMEAKDLYMAKVFEKNALLGLREEFLEAEGNLETLMVQYLRNRINGESGLARLLLSGDKWRQWARGLSAEGAGPRLIAEFQLDYVSHLFWGAYESLWKHEATIFYLKGRLDHLDRP